MIPSIEIDSIVSIIGQIKFFDYLVLDIGGYIRETILIVNVKMPKKIEGCLAKLHFKGVKKRLKLEYIEQTNTDFHLIHPKDHRSKAVEEACYDFKGERNGTGTQIHEMRILIKYHITDQQNFIKWAKEGTAEGVVEFYIPSLDCAENGACVNRNYCVKHRSKKAKKAIRIQLIKLENRDAIERISETVDTDGIQQT